MNKRSRIDFTAKYDTTKCVDCINADEKSQSRLQLATIRWCRGV